jgi:hypothetical protein
MLEGNGTMREVVLEIEVSYDESVTDAEAVAAAADRLLETALSTPGIMDEYGNPTFRELLVKEGSDKLA